MHDPKAYIGERLARLTKPGDISVKKEDLVEYISKALLSKKFRKYAADDALLEHLPKALKLNIHLGEPIKLVFPFGGYKLWRLDEAPEADWAELFSLMYYAAWLKPITDVYGPGVWFDFSSDDIIIEQLNNIPKSETEAYVMSLERVIRFLTAYLPKNLRFTVTSVGSRYTEEEFQADIQAKMDEILAANGGKMPEPSKEEIAMIDLNSNWPEEVKSQSDWYAKNKLVHDAFLAASKRRPYNKAEDKITAFVKPFPRVIAVGTTKTSIAKFWAGVGALKKREDRLIEMVLSPEQVKAASATWVPLSFEGLEGKNFSKIRVIE